jgi:polysaccharide pyruvyl transferase WcaK-like protein
MKVLVSHAYSADNAGDGLLVDETIALVREALGSDVSITLLAARPETFRYLDIPVYPTVPTARGYDRRLRETLRSIDSFDMVVAVGGGYLRAGTLIEAIKAILTHGPQLWATARTRVPSVYLPQSVGPVRGPLRRVLRAVLAKMDSVHLRDDRSVQQFGTLNSHRTPDLATSRVMGGRLPGQVPSSIPVISIRHVHGKINPSIFALAAAIAPYDGYVQSITGGNDDRPAAATLNPTATLERATLMTAGGTPRVVVAVRLHAALMALAAGHYVVHLAYERKGFGAFEDLELAPWVHNVNNFDHVTVRKQVEALLTDAEARADYDRRLLQSAPELAAQRDELIDRIKLLAQVRSAAV